MIQRRYTGAKPKIILPKGAIDTQLHLFMPGFPAQTGGPSLPEGSPGPSEYRQVMDWLDIDRLVITQANAHQLDNDNLLAALEAMGDRARGVGVVTPETSDAEIESLHLKGVRGARIMDLPGGAVGLDALLDVDARAASAGWMMAVQFDGSDIEQQFANLSQLKSRWVFDHHGKFFRGAEPVGPEVDLVKRLIDSGNCWFKFSGCYESSLDGPPDYKDIAAVARVIANYAPERIVWGTNFPHNLAQKTEDYPDDAALLDLAMSWLPNDKSRKLALVDNPEELFGFSALGRLQPAFATPIQ